MVNEVLITGALHETALKAFEANPRLRVRYQPDCSRDELFTYLSTAQVLVTRSETDIDRKVIDGAKDLKVIARAAVGVGNIDVEYATERGILVVNCPGKNTNSAAELTLGHMLGMLRNLPQAQATVKGGGWDRHRFTGRELRGKRIGIVGLGNVGHRVAKFAHGFDMDVYAYDPYIAPEVFERHRVKPCADLMELAAQVDILTVHVPLNKETKGMITQEVLAAMPRGSYFVNAARGGIADEAVLLKVLEDGHLAGVAIDTFMSEPKPMPALLAHPNVWCSPHIGASTVEAQVAIGETVYAQVVKALEGGVVDHPVNLPQVAVIDSPLLQAYAVLAEKLGSMVAQIIDFNPSRVELFYRGDLAQLEHGIVRLGFMKGYASHVVNEYVSFVNAETLVRQLGLEIDETSDPSFQSYRSGLKVSVTGPQGHKLTIGGIVFDDRYIRVSLINDFYFEIEPTGHLLLVENNDRPGVIGDLGHFLGMKGINIGTFELSRNRKGGKAMACIRVDSEMSAADIAAMEGIRNILAIRYVNL